MTDIHAGTAVQSLDRVAPYLTSWPRAATVAERLSPSTNPPSPAELIDDPDGRVGRRMRRWRAAVGLGPDEPFAPLLATIGLDESTLSALLAEDDDRLRMRLNHPEWTSDIEEALAYQESRSVTHSDQMALMRFLIPVVASFGAELHERVTALVEAAGPAYRVVLATLPALLEEGWPSNDLGNAVGRTLVLELHVARLEGRLAGDTPAERFDHFCELLRDPSVSLRLWEEYPVLLRYARDLLRGWVETRVEFATRLIADLGELCEQCSGKRGVDGLGPLTGISFGAGDRHRAGRTVAIVRFARGTVVYKPRPLATDLAWQQVLAWANDRGARHPLRATWVLNRPGYGWMEYVEPGSCGTVTEADAFYWRLGALLALQYALRGVDVHAENLIAAGDQPVLVDLEAVIHPDKPDDVEQPWHGPADALIASGVTAVGLLPMKMISREQGQLRVLDVSAVGVSDDQETPFPIAVIDAAGTDEMRFTEKRITVPRIGDSRVKVNGSDVDPRGHVAALCDGLAWAYRQIVADRLVWTGPGGLVDGFLDVPLRYIARPTMFYGRLLMDSLHPDFGRDYLERCRSLLRLAIGADGTGQWERLVRHELADLNEGDIPYFEYRPATRTVWDSRGEAITDFLAAPPIEAVRARVNGMDEDDLAIQLRLARHAIASLASGVTRAGDGGANVLLTGGPAPAAHADAAEAAREAAAALANRLCDSAIREGDEVGWLSVSLMDEIHWQADAAPLDTYAGIAGVGLFLATVAAEGIATRPVVRETAHQVADTVARRLRGAVDDVARMLARPGRADERLRNLADPGAFGVVGGPIYFFAHAAGLLDRPDLADVAEESLELLHTYVAWDRTYDLIAGSAGAIMAALALHAVRPGGGALSLAEHAAEVLLAAAQPQAEGVGWVSSLSSKAVLGASHGVSGIVLALARLHMVRPRPEYARAIAEGLRYERSMFDARVGNWPDLRDERIGGTGGFMTTWCHGAPGIGLVRAELLRLGVADLHPGGPAAVAEELRWALACTREAFQLPADPTAAGGAAPHSPVTSAHLFGCNVPCHGDLGNLEVMLLDALQRGDEPGLALLSRMVTAIHDRARIEGWRTGVPGVEDTPSLMFGLSGIGYQLLRLTRPADIPSILLLDPPRAAR